MARRILTGGSADEVLGKGEPLWQGEYERDQRRGGYVKGRWSDESPYAALLWADLRAAYRERHITDYQASIFDWCLEGLNNCEIARLMDCDESTVRYHIERVELELSYSRVIGRLTVLVEECGGWRAVGQYMHGNY